MPFLSGALSPEKNPGSSPVLSHILHGFQDTAIMFIWTVTSLMKLQGYTRAQSWLTIMQYGSPFWTSGDKHCWKVLQHAGNYSHFTWVYFDDTKQIGTRKKNFFLILVSLSPWCGLLVSLCLCLYLTSDSFCLVHEHVKIKTYLT